MSFAIGTSAALLEALLGAGSSPELSHLELSCRQQGLQGAVLKLD